MSHHSSARIDLAFGNSALLLFIQGIEYLVGAISDHNPLSLSLAFPLGKRSGGWSLSPGWLQNDQVSSHLLDSISPTRIIVSIEKAFKSIDWQYMLKVLERMGFGMVFRQWISLLYSNPRVAIRLGISTSTFFSVNRGIRQGCPLSLFLFALMMEPLAVALRSSREVEAIRVGNIDEGLALYADDLLLFLKHPGESLKAALLSRV